MDYRRHHDWACPAAALDHSYCPYHLTELILVAASTSTPVERQRILIMVRALNGVSREPVICANITVDRHIDTPRQVQGVKKTETCRTMHRAVEQHILDPQH